MNTFKYMLITLMMLSGTLVGCDKGPMEKAGEKADEAVTDVGNAVEDTCEKVKEGVNAKDTDC